MADSRKKSASEAFINSFGSFPLGYLVGIGILPLMVEWIQNDPLTANIVITAIFALVSFVRTYVLRRIFDKYGFNDNLALDKKMRM
jgi:putative flippase GtrA